MSRFKTIRRTGVAVTLVGLMTMAMGMFVANAASSTNLNLDSACNGAFTPGQLGSLLKTVDVDPDESLPATMRTITFTITYPTDGARNGGRLLDCIMVGETKQGLIASLEDSSDHTSGTFTGSYTVALSGTNPDADIHVDAGEKVCDVAFFTGNDGGNGKPSGQKTPSPICTSLLFPPVTTTTEATTTTTEATTTTVPTTTSEVTTTTVPTTTSEVTTTTVPTTTSEVTTTTVPTTTTSEATTTTLPETSSSIATTTTAPPIVLGKELTTTTSAVGPTVLGKTITQPEQLPFTGSNPEGFIVVAGLLMVLGGGFLLAGRKARS